MESGSQPQTLQEIITRDPANLHLFFSSESLRRIISELITACWQACKSQIPFPRRDWSKVVKRIDRNGNKSYLVHLKRNSPIVNTFNTEILNFWRANMDISILCGNSFSSIVFVTFYTSKTDNSSNIKAVMRKIRNAHADVDTPDETSRTLKRILLNIDTCRCSGEPEASSNILLFPHHYTSSKVLRLDSRIYMSYKEKSN